MNLNETVIINPPLEVPKVHIDSPGFIFYPSYIAYHTLKQKYHQLQYIDAFLTSEIVVTDTSSKIGGSIEAIIEVIYRIQPKHIIVHYSNYSRATGLYDETLSLLFDGLSKICNDIHLADFFLGTTHYLAYSEDELRKIYPSIKAIFKKQFPYHRFMEEDLICLPSDFTQYLPFLNLMGEYRLIKDYNPNEAVFPYILSFGCPYNCTFCQEVGSSWIPRKIDSIKTELRQLQQDGVDRIYIMDSYANFNLSFFKEILSFCYQENIHLHFTNGLGLKHIDEESAVLLTKIISLLYISPESLLESSLQKMRKPFTLPTIMQKLAILKKYQINIYCHFVIKAPHETKEDLEEFFDRLFYTSKQFQIRPFIQIYNSSEDLYVSTKFCINKYTLFTIEHREDNWLHEIENQYWLKLSTL